MQLRLKWARRTESLVLSAEYWIWLIARALLLSAFIAPAAAQTAPATPLPSGPVEILERFGIDDSQLAGLANGQPLTPSEEELLIKILYRFPRMGLDNLQRWRRKDVSWDKLAASADEFRGQVFSVRGRVRRVERRELSPEQADLFEFRHYYHVTLAIDVAPYEALVVARWVPAAWQIDAPLEEPAAADALFLKLGDSTRQNPRLVFAAGRLAWLPEKVDVQRGIGSSHVVLSKRGMDAGLWDVVRGTNRTGLGGADREAFYQLLAAVKKDRFASLGTAAEPVSVAALLEEPAAHQGEVLAVEGLARRVMKISVSDADVRSRFGLDHYYEIDLFLPLGKTSLRLGNDPTGENSPVYRNSFPATLIVPTLPAGLEEGEIVHEQVRADAVFFKIWTYRSSYTAKFGQLQPAPLFVAGGASVIETKRSANPVVDILVGTMLALVAVVLAAGIWWSRRSATRRRPAAAIASPPPNFSNLA